MTTAHTWVDEYLAKNVFMKQIKINIHDQGTRY